MNINDKLKRILKEKNMNARRLSIISGVCHENIYKILNEKNNNPGVYTVKALSDALDISIEDLI